MARRQARAGAVSISIDGLRELDQAFDELMASTSSRNAKNAMRRALRKAAEPMADRMRQLAPVDSGVLRDSIVVTSRIENTVGRAEYRKVMDGGGSAEEAVAAMRQARRAAKAEGSTGSTIEVYVGALKRASHAYWVEFGTRKMPPHPFARPAFEETQEGVVASIKDHLRLELEKAAKRAARKAAKLAAKGTS